MSLMHSTRIAVSSTALVMMASISTAADRHVPSFYPTIQQAINAAASGDSVLIQPGIYEENINLNGKNITIKPFNNNFDTIIDGGADGPVVTFKGTESNKCSVRGLVLRNGKASTGAGVLGNNTLAEIRNCTIGANVASGSGGGIHGVSGLIQNCTITLNQAANGGGISDCDGMIDSCLILQNKATSTGGGIYNSEATIQFCEITENEASTRGGGVQQCNGVIQANLVNENFVTATGPTNNPAGFGGGLNDCAGTVTLNLIADNMSTGDGGGVANSSGVFQNNVIVDNGARRGGGLASLTGRVENNTIWNNTASHIGGGCFNLGTLVSNCIIFSNSAQADAQWSGANVPTFSCVQNWAGGQPDIITLDPMLVDPGKNRFELLPGSPCIDAGKLIADITLDYEGEARPADGTPIPRGDGSDYDIGADEFMASNVDLSVMWMDVKTKYKKEIPKLKTSIQGKFLVACSGNDSIDVPFGVQFFLSDDAVLDGGDAPVGKFITVKKLKTGKSKKSKCKVKFPLNTVVTGKFLIGVADTSGSIAELDENNNSAVFGPLP